MPTDHARKKTVRRIQRTYGVSYTDAVAIERDPRMEAICDVLSSADVRTHAGALAVLDDPLNQTLCEECGWIVAWVCPECPGCGCYSGQCSGWRHAEVSAMYGDDDPEEAMGCDECGSGSGGPYDECMCDEFVA